MRTDHSQLGEGRVAGPGADHPGGDSHRAKGWSPRSIPRAADVTAHPLLRCHVGLSIVCRDLLSEHNTQGQSTWLT